MKCSVWKVETCEHQRWESRHTAAPCSSENAASAPKLVAEGYRAIVGNSGPATPVRHLDFHVAPISSRILEDDNSPRPSVTGSSTAPREVDGPIREERSLDLNFPWIPRASPKLSYTCRGCLRGRDAPPCAHLLDRERWDKRPETQVSPCVCGSHKQMQVRMFLVNQCFLRETMLQPRKGVGRLFATSMWHAVQSFGKNASNVNRIFDDWCFFVSRSPRQRVRSSVVTTG